MFSNSGGNLPPQGASCPEWLREKLLFAGGWLPWNTIMEAALYDPDHGYYAGTPRRIGRSGDFFTAVSVGPLYGRLLAEQTARVWETAGRPASFVLAEQAAHDGQLMADMLAEIQVRHPDLAAAVEVTLVEPQEGYREAQKATLARIWAKEPRWLASVNELASATGMLVCNELLDAFPVHRVVKQGGQWLELGVELAPDQAALAWAGRPMTDESLRAGCERLPSELAEGYVTEIQTAAAAWMRDLGRSGFHGTVCVADYGLDAEDYWSPERSEGTLRRYWQHRMDDQVLDHLGEADLTCHVNFTNVITTAESTGFKVFENTDQGRFLTRLAASWLRSLEGRAPDRETAALLRQFQSLTHPGIMGRSFRVLLLERLGRL